jgi:hypothetical protein
MRDTVNLAGTSIILEVMSQNLENSPGHPRPWLSGSRVAMLHAGFDRGVETLDAG